MSIVGNADNTFVGVVCAGTALSGAQQLYDGVSYVEVSGSTSSANSVNLPVAPYLGEQYTIRNDSSLPINIFPGTSSCTINALSGGSSMSLPAGGVVCLLPATTSSSGATQWYSMSPPSGSNNSSQVISGATSLVSSSPSINIISQVGGNYVVNLPAVSSGLKYDFIIGAGAGVTGSSNVTIHGATGIMFGDLLNESTASSTGANVTNYLTKSNVSFTGSSNPGDKFTVVSDGVNWYGQGVSSL
jgi:hypothetical protein